MEQSWRGPSLDWGLGDVLPSVGQASGPWDLDGDSRTRSRVDQAFEDWLFPGNGLGGCPCASHAAFARDSGERARTAASGEHEGFWLERCESDLSTWEACMRQRGHDPRDTLWAECDPGPCPESELHPGDPSAAYLCGGDVTDALVEELQKAYADCHKGLHLPNTVGWIWDLEQRLNWKRDTRKRSEWRCDTGCPRTLFLCGHCLEHSVPGNIMGGYVPHVCGFTAPGTRSGAWIVAGFDWPQHDRDAVEIGIALSGRVMHGNLCALVRKAVKNKRLQAPDEKRCTNAPKCA